MPVGLTAQALDVTPEVRENVNKSAINIPGVTTNNSKKGTDSQGENSAPFY
jgi:hypothetical protein